MLRYAVFCFAITLIASLVGFGGLLGTAVAMIKALAVVFLLLFFVMLYRVLAEVDPAPSADS